MNVRSFSKRVIALLLSFVLLTGMLPVGALATETEPTVTATTEATEPEVIAVTGIALDQTALEVGVGELPITLTATVLPEDATDKTVTWTSSESGVVSVENGVLTFGYMGEAVITATAGDFTATCTVKVDEGDWTDYAGETTYVLAGSDFQASSDSASAANVTAILSAIDDDYSTMDGFLFGGDLSQSMSTRASASGKTALQKAVQAVYGTAMDEIYVQGNHDPDDTVGSTCSTSGAHDTDAYGVYVINERDYPWGYSTSSTYKSTVQATATALDAYLDAKVVEGYSKPIFVASHIPLHYTTRTSGQNDAMHANLLFDVLNEAGGKGLNIIFLFGHNHSTAYDSYLGQGAIYLAEGDKINIAQGSTTSYNEETLNFTYMNYGYVGYIGSTDADGTLTMTVFEITDEQVSVKRYSEDDVHSLKAAGGTTSIPNGVSANSTVYSSPQTIALTTPVADGTEGDSGSGDSSTDDSTTGGSTSGATVYTLDTDGIDAGEEYLIVSTGTDGTGSALTVSSGESVGTTVTISGGQIETDATDLIWVISGTDSGTAYNEATGYYVYPSSTSGQDPVIRSSTCDLLFTHNGNGEYVIKRDFSYGDYYVSSSDDWGYSSSETTVYLYKKTSEGTGTGSGSTGGGTVDTEGGDWVTISSGVGGTIYTLDEDGLNVGSDEKYLIVDTSANGTGNAMTNSSGTAANTTVTIADKVIVVEDDANVAWTPTGSSTSANFANGDYNIYLSYGNGVLYTRTRNLVVSHQGDGAYTLKRDSNSSGYYVQYSDSDGWNTLSTTSKSVYLYRKTGTETAGDAEYAKLVGELTYTIDRGLDEEAALAEVMKGIDVVISGDKTTETTLEDGNTDIKWELASNYSGTTAGEYAVKIYYKEKLLGTAKVIVPEVNITGITCDEAGAVSKGASQKAETGAYITISYEDGTTSQIPVTVGMLTDADGNKVSTATVGTISDLYVNYNGQKFPFTLTVNPKSGNNYPTYPDPGAVKVNKTATGIDFQASGVATVELSASGIPMNEGVDILLVLDTSSSMDFQGSLTDKNATRISVLYDCINALIDNLNDTREDGSVPDIDIAMVDFNGYVGNKSTNYIGSTAKSTSSVGGLLTDGWMSVNDEAFANNDWANETNIPQRSGTNYDHGLQQAYELLEQRQIDAPGRKQFVLFMSDGAPFQYNGVNSNSVNTDWEQWILGSYTQEEVEAISTITNPEFYYGNNSGNGQKHRIAEAIKGAPEQAYEVVFFDGTSSSATASMETVYGLGATMYSVGLALEGTNMPTDVAGQEAILKTIASSEDVFYSVTSAAGLQEAFDDFAGAVLLAATDATFADAMGAAYDLQLTPVDYLPTGETTNYSTITPTIEFRSYEIWTRAEYEAGDFTDENQIGTRKTNADGSYIYTTLETITFQYAKNGTNDYTLTGATSDQLTDTNILVDGVVCGKYVYYNTTSETKTVTVNGKEVSIAAESFYWVIGDIKTTELALRYNVYLTNSLQGGVTEGSYDTNGKAILSYTNYLGNACTKEAVSPTMAWKGALVRYAFYLVDASSGKPVNNDGTEVPFSNRTVIVDPTFYANVNLFSSDDVESMSIAAQGVIPAGYWLYDESAAYAVTVRGNGTGYWEITGDATLNNPNSTYVTGFDGDNYTNVDSDSASYDYTHTTVWFAVKWEPQAVPDTIVIDYGLPVDIHVLTNDMFGKYGKLVGIQAGVVAQPENNTGTCPITAASDEGSFGTAVINAPETGYTEANSVIRYTPNTMEITGSDQFTYAVQYDNPVANDSNGYYYGTLTIIPATTIYYEDEFVDLSSYTWSYDTNGWVKKETSGWTVVTDETYVEGEDITQAEDRPDDVNYAFDTVIDANNIYGYDGAYDECSQYSLGSAVKAHVDYDNYAEASFSFYGTGFDVVSLSSSQTGAIYVEVDDANGNRVRDLAVDTYYGMTEDGELVANDPSALYQVPVIEVSGLTYGKYTVTIKAVYNEIFDHEQYSDNTYDFYLDAIRIYDPAGTPEDDTIEDAYKADEEGWPIYEEVRDNVISAAELEGSTELPGIVFIDSVDEVASVADYTDLGPNNELYLAANQAIAFQLDLSGYDVASVHLGIKSAAGDTVSYKVFNGTENLDKEAIAALPANSIETSTGMYYDITSLKDGVIVIYNAGTGMLSVTDVKITFNVDPGVVENLFYASADTINKLVENLNKTPEEEVTAPETFEVTAPETTVVGSRITVKVTTSADVDAVSIDGTMVTRYSTDANGNRVWTARVSASESGTKGIVVNTYNSDGYQSATKTASVTVNSAEETVETIIRKIADLFKGWFGW